MLRRTDSQIRKRKFRWQTSTQSSIRRLQIGPSLLNVCQTALRNNFYANCETVLLICTLFLNVSFELKIKCSTLIRYKIPEYKSKQSRMNYAFEIEDVPTEADYLEVVYSSKHPALPSDLRGETFSRIFGANQSRYITATFIVLRCNELINFQFILPSLTL